MLDEEKIIRHLNAIASGNARRLVKAFPKTFVVVREPQMLNTFDALEGSETVMGYGYEMYLEPEKSVVISKQTANRLIDEMGLVQLCRDENSRIWGDEEETFLEKYRGYFGAQIPKRNHRDGYALKKKPTQTLRQF